MLKTSVGARESAAVSAVKYYFAKDLFRKAVNI